MDNPVYRFVFASSSTFVPPYQTLSTNASSQALVSSFYQLAVHIRISLTYNSKPLPFASSSAILIFIIVVGGDKHALLLCLPTLLRRGLDK
jgi:hypothetical protein